MQHDVLGHWRSSRAVRRALARRAAAAVVAGLIALWIGARVHDADAVRARWGPTTRVLVATSDLPAGALPTEADVTALDWPRALEPPGALHALPAGDRRRHLRQPLTRGQVVTGAHLGEPGRGTWAAQLDPDRVALRVPLAAALEGLATGDAVDVVAPTGSTADAWADPARTDPTRSGTDGSGPGAATLGVARVADAAQVLAVEPDGVVLAVRRSESAPTAAAAMAGVVALVVLP